MIYICEDFPSTLLDKHVFPCDMEDLFIELNFRECKWKLFRTYHQPLQEDAYVDNLNKALDSYSNYQKHLHSNISKFRIDSFFYTVVLKEHLKVLILKIILRASNRRLNNSRINACATVELTLVQPSIRRLYNRRFNACKINFILLCSREKHCKHQHKPFPKFYTLVLLQIQQR